MLTDDHSIKVHLSDEAAAEMQVRLVACQGSTARVRITVNPHAEIAAKYELEIDDSALSRRDDVAMCSNGVNIVTDAASAVILSGARIEFSRNMWQTGFRFILTRPALIMREPWAEELIAYFGERVIPTLAQHGGSGAIIDVHRETVYVALSGGCQGCGAAVLTVKGSILATLRVFRPTIRQVIDLTDHAAGTAPYIE